MLGIKIKVCLKLTALVSMVKPLHSKYDSAGVPCVVCCCGMLYKAPVFQPGRLKGDFTDLSWTKCRSLAVCIPCSKGLG